MLCKLLINSFRRYPQTICRNYHITSRILDVNTHFLTEICAQATRGLHTERHIRTREEKYKIKDKIPLDWDMIYRLPSIKLLQVLNTVGCFTLFGVIGISTHQLFQTNTADMLVPVENWATAGAQFSNIEMIVFLSSLFLFNLVIRKVVSEYAVRIYNKDNKYKSITLGFIPGTIKTVEFESGEVREWHGLKYIPWGNSRYLANKNVIIMFEDNFRTPAHMFAMFTK